MNSVENNLKKVENGFKNSKAEKLIRIKKKLITNLTKLIKKHF